MIASTILVCGSLTPIASQTFKLRARFLLKALERQAVVRPSIANPIMKTSEESSPARTARDDADEWDALAKADEDVVRYQGTVEHSPWEVFVKDRAPPPILGLPTEELIPLAEKLLEVPQELPRTALDLELQEGTVVADRAQVGTWKLLKDD